MSIREIDAAGGATGQACIHLYVEINAEPHSLQPKESSFLLVREP